MKISVHSNEQIITTQKEYYDKIYRQYEEEAAKASFSNKGIAFSQKILSVIPSHSVCLELACGPGIWTNRLLNKADKIIAIDASPNMLKRNKQRCSSSKITYVQDDIFNFPTLGTFPIIFASFWISHIPSRKFDDFWKYIHNTLEPSGIAFFIDSYPDSSPRSGAVRTFSNSTIHIIKKNYNTPPHLKTIKKIGFSVFAENISNKCYMIMAQKI